MLDPKIVKQTIEGYREANRVIEEERKQRLQSMTKEESSAIYDNLCEFYYSHMKKEDFEKLEPLKIEFLVRRRQLFDKFARLKKSNEQAK